MSALPSSSSGPAAERHERHERPPIVVDLDGTLTPSDTLAESLLQLARHSPLGLLRVAMSAFAGRAAFKAAVAARVRLSPARLPYREALLAYLQRQRSEGRRIILATAAHASIARGVADHLGLFDDVLATEQDRNLKGREKLDACRRRVGPRFVYAADSRADIPLWRAAQAAIPVAPDRATARWLRQNVPIEFEFGAQPGSALDWLHALRVHHWLKNLLVLVPLLTSFRLVDAAALGSGLVAFLAFSLVASATYIANDLCDLDNDRAHPRKKHRPFAAARLSIAAGVGGAATALGAGLALGAAVGRPFLAVLLSYLVLTTAYSVALKRVAILDVVMLALLHTLRVLAGAVAIGVSTSPWLLAFSAVFFLSLALAKRCSELIACRHDGVQQVDGRDYRVADLATLHPLGIAAATSAVVVFGLFINAPETQSRYASPHLLWLAAGALIYWLGRLWLATARGQTHEDPLVFSLHDRVSLGTLMVIVGVVLAAHFIGLGDPP